MSTATLTREPAPTDSAAPAYKITGPRVVRSEWAKLWSLRSTWITLGLAMVLTVMFGLISAVSWSPSGTTQGLGDGKDAVQLALGGMEIVALTIGVLGVLLTAGEYATGMIRSTLTAVPKRLPVLWSKAGLYAGIAFVIGFAAVVVSFLGGTGILSGESISLTLSDSGVLRSLLGAAAYLSLVGVIGVALGALLRSVAGAITSLVGLLMLLPALVGLLPNGFSDAVSQYLPSNAGGSMYALTQGSDSLSPGAGLAVFAGWTALLLGLAAYRLKRTDV
jgi:ABC-type transport system involved in multi-copper enzyme maturation permease subunit